MFLQTPVLSHDAAKHDVAKKDQPAAAKTKQHYGTIDDLEYAANEHHTMSLSQINDALKKNPTSSELIADKARADMLDGEDEAATDALNKLIAHDPHFGRAYLLRSAIDLGKDNWDAAYSDLKKAEQFGSPNVSIAATERLAMNLRERKRYPEAKVEYDKLISSGLLTQHLLGRIIYQRAEIFLRTNRLEEGLAGIADALKADPYLGIAYMTRARVYSGMGKMQDALQNYTKVIENETNHSRRMSSDLLLDSYRERAKIYQSLGRKDLARRDLVTAKQYDRDTIKHFLFRTQ